MPAHLSCRLGANDLLGALLGLISRATYTPISMNDTAWGPPGADEVLAARRASGGLASASALQQPQWRADAVFKASHRGTSWRV